MDGNSNGAGLVRDGSGDRLPYPPRRVGAKLVALTVIELLHRLDQTQIALLDEIQKQHTTAYIALRYADDQAQVRFGKALFCRDVALLHPLRQVDLLVRGQQRNLSNLLEIHPDRVVDTDPLRQRQIELFLLRRLINKSYDIDVVILKVIVDLFDCIGAQVHVLKCIHNLTVFQHILFLLCRFQEHFQFLTELLSISLLHFSHPFEAVSFLSAMALGPLG